MRCLGNEVVGGNQDTYNDEVVCGSISHILADNLEKCGNITAKIHYCIKNGYEEVQEKMISTRGRYALMFMLDVLGNYSRKPVRLKDVAARQGLSEKYLEQIAVALRKSGLIESSRGSGGGYYISRAAGSISVGEILRAMEGDLAPAPCMQEDSQCEKRTKCVNAVVWGKLNDAINGVVDSITLADMGKWEKEMKKYCFYGWESTDIEPIDLKYQMITSPRELYDILSELWCAQTCAPRMRAEWTARNKTMGQCSITAFLVQDIFGGNVYGILRDGGNYHCYNVVQGCCFDLTSEQFGEEAAQLVYKGNPEQFREIHFAKEEKRMRYELLKHKLQKRLNIIS